MERELPDDIDCRQISGGAESVSGTVGAKRLGRVAAAYRITEPARAALRLERDAYGRAVIEGSLTAKLEGRCQRCLEWAPIAIDAQVSVIALTSPTERRDEREDCVAAPGGRLALLELIEDEILLACPMTVMHELGACRAPGEHAEGIGGERQTPFAHLVDLLKQGR